MTMGLRGLCIFLVSAIGFSVALSQLPVNAAEPEEEKSNESVTPTDAMQQIARLTVANELMRRHWVTWVSGKELRKIAKQAAKGINDELELRAEVEYLLPVVKARPQKRTVEEERAVADIRAGVAEVWRDGPDGTHYIRGIRATTACIQCHQALGTPRGELGEGDLLGIISLKLNVVRKTGSPGKAPF